MERIVVTYESVAGADYSGLSLDQFSAQGSTFEDCKFDRAKVGDSSFGAGMEQSFYVCCSFDRASLTSLGGYVRFVSCTFRNTRFIRPSADYLEFVDCSFTGRIAGLEMRGSPYEGQQRFESNVRALARQGKPEPPGYREIALRERNQIQGNDFTGAELVKVHFRFGVDLDAQRLPVGDDYMYLPDGETTVLRALATLAPDPSPEAAKARWFLEEVLLREVNYGQRQILLRPKNFERSKAVPPEVLLATEILKRSVGHG